jgi:hypothetical protein
MMLMAHLVCAQTEHPAPARPYRTLFGSTDASRPSLHALDLTLSINGAADNGLAPPASVEESPQSGFQQLYSAVALLNYVMRGRRFSADAGGSASLPRYTGFNDLLSTLGYSGNAGLDFTSGATSARAYGSYVYSPYYFAALDPGTTPTPSAALDPGTTPTPSAPPFDYASARSPYDQTTAGASFTRRLGRRTSATLGYSYNSMWFENDSQSNHSQDARISADRRLSRRFRLRGSYAYRNGEYVTAATQSTDTSQDIDLALGYNRALPRGEAVTIDLSLGSSIIGDALAQQRSLWRGSASASGPIGAGWTVGGGVSRTLQFNSVVQQPVVADVANADVSGVVGRRVTLTFAATYSNGEGQVPGSQRFHIYSGSARAQFGLASFAAIDVQYIYYYYDFPPGYQLPEGVPVQMNRQRVQIGASFWLPLVRAGRAGDTRSSASQ